MHIHIGKQVIEEEMDYFAACILMPTKSFRKAYTVLYQRGCKNISHMLANLFNVPIESAVRRIDELHIIGSV